MHLPNPGLGGLPPPWARGAARKKKLKERSDTIQFDAASSTLQFRMDRIDPPQLCDGATCYPTPPIMPMGQVLSTQLQFVQQNLYVVQDASGPLRFIKQP